ncbi:hypothetical protein AB4865_12545 [Capnocytophaga sp. ARDL2]|uniref:hypothetical protein n=1 Tax=Capnocytophaga sp. ARDL2 TaxID=3238809 RepID=UPI0035572981
MKKTLFILTMISIFVSCKQEETPKVIYPKSEEQIEFQKIDTIELKITDLPIHIKGLDYLIHPIGKIGVKNSKGNYEYTNAVNYHIASYNYPQITGAIHNIAFQDIATDSVKVLTNHKMHIHSITYLDEIASNKKYLLYELYDIDTNKDKAIDVKDIKSLYLSEQSGHEFTKISPQLQEVIDWKVIKAKNKLYFRTIDDINKNGIFDPKDILNHYFIDFTADSLEIVKYNIEHR